MSDYVAAYLIPQDLWYIIPEEMIRGQGSIAVYPPLKKSKYGRYREAWHLLGAAGGGLGLRGQVVFFLRCLFGGVRSAAASRVNPKPGPTPPLPRRVGATARPPCITSPPNGKGG